MDKSDHLPIYDKLLKKIFAYYQTIWREKWREDIHNEWLNNFINVDDDDQYSERLNMLYLLTKFMYFGNDEMRELLNSLYRDLFKYPIVANIRKTKVTTLDFNLIESEFQMELAVTRFLGVGNPSESGVHMLYYLRQECDLSKDYFINSSEIFSTKKVRRSLPDGSEREVLESELADSNVRRYIFIDDFCGSGSQANGYLKDMVDNLKFKDPTVEVNYYMLFGTENGITNVKRVGIFNEVKAVFTIDDSFKAFSDNSRYYFNVPDAKIQKAYAKQTAANYGTTLFSHALGYRDCQLLLGLFHNTPDNTLPVFWATKNWKPVFKRYNKIY
jgi:hypothetical protein